MYLQHLFKKKPVDITKAYMYLEEIKDPSEMLLVCERLLSKSMAIPNVVFLIHFMTTELDNVLIPERKRELLRQRLGANALLCIPESNRLPYVSLVSQPLLLLEQLLMDMKVEWAAKVFNDLQNELSTSTSYDESHRKEVSVDAFEKLLIVYAKKALEFEVVSYQQTSKEFRILCIVSSYFCFPYSSHVALLFSLPFPLSLYIPSLLYSFPSIFLPLLPLSLV